jgi:CRP-like cAMP-binding protein
MKEDNRVGTDRAKLEADVAAHPFLIGISAHHIRLLADCAMRSHFEAGKVIFREGESANRFYLIEHGRIALESSTFGEPITIEEIHDGDLLGWSWLFPPYAWHFSARALEDYDRAFLLRNRLAGLLREGQFSRFRTVQADERSDAAKIASRAREIIKRSSNPVEHSGSMLGNPGVGL